MAYGIKKLRCLAVIDGFKQETQSIQVGKATRLRGRPLTVAEAVYTKAGRAECAAQS